MIRRGEFHEIHSKHIVKGDIVVVKGGDIIPCDMVIMHEGLVGMKVNNYNITSSNEEIKINPNRKDADILKSPNVAFYGTKCTEG